MFNYAIVHDVHKDGSKICIMTATTSERQQPDDPDCILVDKDPAQYMYKEYKDGKWVNPKKPYPPRG